MTREVVGVVSEKSIATLYDDIEAAWLQQRPDLDLATACTLLRMERVNQLDEMRVQALSKTVGLQTGELHVLLALRRSGKPYELRPRLARHLRCHDQTCRKTSSGRLHFSCLRQ